LVGAAFDLLFLFASVDVDVAVLDLSVVFVCCSTFVFIGSLKSSF